MITNSQNGPWTSRRHSSGRAVANCSRVHKNLTQHDSVVGIAPATGWKVRGSKHGRGKGFALLVVRPDTQPPVQWVPELFARGKAGSAWR